MYVLVDLQERTVELVEPDDFSRFHLEVTGGFDEAEVERLLGNRGSLDGVDHAYVSVAAVREWAGDAVSEKWATGFEQMLAYAREKGWLDEAGTAIRAHVEWPPDSIA